MSFLLYGANGYTGELITRLAAEQGIKPILAGRSADKVKPLAERYGMPYRIFDLSDTAALEAALSEVKVVLHAAGPFMYTAKPMIEACLRKGVHYLDITGEMEIFEMAASLDAKAQAANIMLMPGVGFDVVPTDCLAKHLSELMPDAKFLRLAFAGNAGLSQGTAITMAENLGNGGAIRKDGKIISVPNAYKRRDIPFTANKTLHTMTIPWGDVSTAYYTTGIPNIEVYLGVPPKVAKTSARANWFKWVFKLNFVKRAIINKIKKRPAGPNDEQRAKSKTLLWGEAENAQGTIITARLITPEGYTVTAFTALTIAMKVLSGNAPIGYQTPAKAYGKGLILEMEGTQFS